MIISHNGMLLEGAEVLGQTLRAADDDSLWAVWELDNCAVGATVETGRARPFLRLCPSVQIPRRLCRGDELGRFLFYAEDERMARLRVDPDDGEVTLVRDLAGLDRGELEAALVEELGFLDDVACPCLAQWVSEKLGLDS